MQHAVCETTYLLWTTLLDAERYPVRDLEELYHGRSNVGELFKVSKRLLKVEGFHRRSEEAVKQDLYAHFTLIAMARLFASHSERHFERRDVRPCG